MEYTELVNRVDGRSPFAEQGDTGDGDGEEKQSVRNFARSALRAAVDVSIVLVPVAICVGTGIVPAPVIESCKSVAAAIGKSPIEPVSASNFLGFIYITFVLWMCVCVLVRYMLFESIHFVSSPLNLLSPTTPFYLVTRSLGVGFSEPPARRFSMD